MFTTTASKFGESCPAGRFNHLKQQILWLLQQGLQPRQLALALALGATIGLLPTLWGTSLVCLLVATLLRVNQFAIQLANILVYPLQLFFFIPYFKLGGTLFSKPFPGEPSDIFWQHLKTAPLSVLNDYWLANLQAVFAWLLTMPFLLAAAFFISLLLVEQLRTSKEQKQF